MPQALTSSRDSQSLVDYVHWLALWAHGNTHRGLAVYARAQLSDSIWARCISLGDERRAAEPVEERLNHCCRRSPPDSRHTLQLIHSLWSQAGSGGR
jgi:hypothetical protein